MTSYPEGELKGDLRPLQGPGGLVDAKWAFRSATPSVQIFPSLFVKYFFAPHDNFFFTDSRKSYDDADDGFRKIH